ncbi:MAG: PH domain-containing protein [Polyangiaceae bacterium]|jgi:hypothetical protein|nr:PH domain-containing protein [Polyangiaceae bacterium]
MDTEIDYEPIPGLPDGLPEGERVLWQGKPSWKSLAVEAFHVRWVAGYLAVFLGARLVVSLRAGQGLAEVVGAALLTALCLGVLAGMAWLNARATTYTITSRRVVLRIGVAIPTTWNLPFKRLASADLSLRSADDGDIMLRVAEPDRIAWLHLWPHVAPFQFARARPTLRAISAPQQVSSLLAEAVASWARSEQAVVRVVQNSREDEAVSPPLGATEAGR